MNGSCSVVGEDFFHLSSHGNSVSSVILYKCFCKLKYTMINMYMIDNDKFLPHNIL